MCNYGVWGVSRSVICKPGKDISKFKGLITKGAPDVDSSPGLKAGGLGAPRAEKIDNVLVEAIR